MGIFLYCSQLQVHPRATLAFSDTFSDRIHRTTISGCLCFHSKIEVHNEIRYSDDYNTITWEVTCCKTGSRRLDQICGVKSYTYSKNVLLKGNDV